MTGPLAFADNSGMNASEPQPPALTKILDECAHLAGEERPTATLRLRQAIGEELSRLLLHSLAGDHRRAGLGASQS
jgi:hypothetical protein